MSAFNQQGQRDPWEKPPPFDIEKQLAAIKKWIIPGVIVLVIIIGAATSYFTVDTEQEAVVLRFGKYLETAGPGLHFKAPFGIDKALIRGVEVVQKEEFGFRADAAAEPSRYGRRYNAGPQDVKEEALMLTADLNCAVVNWVVRYKIGDLKEYLFNVQDVGGIIRDVSEAVMRRIVGDSSIDEVLMTRQGEIEAMALEEMQQFLNSYQCGVMIRAVELKRVDPPEEVSDAFNAVNQAEQMKEKIVNEAEARRNRELIPAEGKKKRAIAEAEGYRQKRIKESEGNAKAFLAVLEEYQKAKDITRRRLYLETMAKILPQCGKLYLIDESQKGILPLLRLGEETK